jgi:hypothetical protein
MTPRRFSSRLTAFDAAPFDSLNASAAAEKDPCSTTLAKTTHALKSGNMLFMEEVYCQNFLFATDHRG